MVPIVPHRGAGPILFGMTRNALPSGSLEALEEQLGAHLPETYRRFLREHNGGQPTPDVVDVDGLPGSPTDIQVFFGIGCTVESSEIEWNWRTFSGRIPLRVLPIACDSGGGLFCLSLSGQDSGSVIFFDAQGPMSIEYPLPRISMPS